MRYRYRCDTPKDNTLADALKLNFVFEFTETDSRSAGTHGTAIKEQRAEAFFSFLGGQEHFRRFPLKAERHARCVCGGTVRGRALSPSTRRELSSISVPVLLRRSPPSRRREFSNISARRKAQKPFTASNSTTNCSCPSPSRGLRDNTHRGALLRGRCLTGALSCLCARSEIWRRSRTLCALPRSALMQCARCRSR